MLASLFSFCFLDEVVRQCASARREGGYGVESISDGSRLCHFGGVFFHFALTQNVFVHALRGVCGSIVYECVMLTSLKNLGPR